MNKVHSDQIKISIIISSYNYELYIGQAIDSALAVKWPDVEVIVVDDGSTDGSPEIIRSYSERIISVFQTNAGRVNACNTGFSLATGDMVLFLDSDDVLSPDIVQEAMKVWSPDVSKIQFQMALIDANGAAIGQIKPSFAIKPQNKQIRRWFFNTGAYPASIGSGNLYTKKFLSEIFPLDKNIWDSSDSCCLAAAPVYGPVETVVKPLVYYRVHGKNASLATQIDSSFSRKEIVRAQLRFAYAVEYAASKGIKLKKKSLFRSLAFAADRAISYRLEPHQHPIVDDNLFRIAKDTVLAALSPQGLSSPFCIAKSSYILLLCFMPTRVVYYILSRRFKTPSTKRKLIAGN